MGSNGTVDERLAEAEAARAVLGASWREQPAPAGSGHRLEPGSPAGGGRPRAVRPAARRGRAVLVRSSSRSRARERAAHRGGLQRRPPPLRRAAARRGSPTRSATTSSTITCAPSFVVDVSDDYEAKRRALACHATPVRARPAGAVATRLTSSRFQQLIESRDAQFGAQARRGVRGRIRRAADARAAASARRRPDYGPRTTGPP